MGDTGTGTREPPRSRATHCLWGHPTPRGTRQCPACQQAWRRERAAVAGLGALGMALLWWLRH